MSKGADSPTSPESKVSYDLDAILLSMVPGVGPLLYQKLIEQFGSATSALNASLPSLMEIPGISVRVGSAILEARHTIDAKGEIARCAAAGITITTRGSPGYPFALSQIPDPPPILYIDGELHPRDSLAVAIVGTRHATTYGMGQARILAAALARAGFTIVSGLARGIDATAHRAALEAGGRTIAVLASGLQNIYPPEHKELAAEIRFQGALICEGGLHTRPARGLFPRRNRIISGLSLGLIVVEAGSRSGALTSARHAMEQNREVMAVPGRVDNRMSHGCHALLRDGATLIESAQDVIDALGPLAHGVQITPESILRHPAELHLNEQENQVLQAIDTIATSIDSVVATTGLPASRVLATISALEMRRMVRRVSGQYLIRS
jgi:DNA processing protein